MKTTVSRTAPRRTPVRRVFAVALLTAAFGLAACHDGHPGHDGDHHGDHHYENH